MKREGFPSTWGSPRLVIPAHAGIQVCSAELAWIPAFAGMTNPGGLFVLIPKQVFSKETRRHEGSMKGGCETRPYTKLRALRVFVVK